MASSVPPVNGNGNGGIHVGNAGSFGSCCVAMGDILGTQDFSPFFAVEEETGVLFMAVGNAEIESDNPEEDGEMAWFDQPVMFCPFCGTSLQTPEGIEEKLGEIEEED